MNNDNVLSKDVSRNNITFHTENLTKDYPSGETVVQALRGVSLDIPKGDMVVLLGPSGSGKSTFLNIIGGLDSPTSGEVYFHNDRLSHYTEQELTLFRRHNVGFVFQAYNLVPSLTALENVALVTDISLDPMPPMEALAAVHLEDRARHFPSQLSGGEQQRVAIARALAKRPEVLLCDEPTGALDSETGIVVLKALQEVNRTYGTTTIIITHNASISAMADRVIHFADGQAVEVQLNDNPVSPEEISW
ncbi:ABC transporter ATP-binding protein [Paremcibacter congregatus]|uniref:ABC transporter ATP-binding protein n=1 Tax=Paremcibacter congregatus TaxID=2043170 RepID=UPI0030EB3484|tara:strand:+ start:1822 stop:2565 length:744 start_codon:yes stop_codon:yes gene_type:complete